MSKSTEQILIITQLKDAIHAAVSNARDMTRVFKLLEDQFKSTLGPLKLVKQDIGESGGKATYLTETLDQLTVSVKALAEGGYVTSAAIKDGTVAFKAQCVEVQNDTKATNALIQAQENLAYKERDAANAIKERTVAQRNAQIASGASIYIPSDVRSGLLATGTVTPGISPTERDALYAQQETAKRKLLNDELRQYQVEQDKSAAAAERKSARTREALKAELLEERRLQAEKQRLVEIQRQAQMNILGIGSTLGINQNVLKQANLADFTKFQTAQNQLAQTMAKNNISMTQMQNMWQSMVTRSPMGALTKEGQEVYSQLQRVATLYAGMDKDFAKSFNAISRGAEDAKKKVAEFNISWQLALKLVAVQLTHQAISAFIRELRAGALYAIEVQKRVAEIRTISQDQQLTSPEWIRGFANISSKYGIDLLDQIAGGYEAISNQIAKGAETFKFMEEASKFAITAVTNTKDSVNLLSTAINAYGLNVADAEKVSAIFFKTIEVGRIRGNEMANMGQLLVPAEQLGIKLEEIGALVATLTIRGMKASETFTQLRGIFTALLRPTEEMKKFFKEMGVESGEQLLATYGLVGTFEALRTKTQGYSSELSALVPRIRGIAGAVALTGDALNTYKKYWYEIGHGTEYYRKAVSIAMESSGRKIQIEIEKVKNYFRTELGSEALGYVLQFSNAIGGLENAVKALVKTVEGLLPVMIGFGLYASKQLIKGHPYAVIVAGIASAIKTLTEYNKLNEMAAQEFVDNWTKAISDVEKAHAEAINRSIIKLQEGLANYSKRINIVVTELTLENNKVLNEYTESYINSFKLIETEHDNMMTEFNNGLAIIKKQASEAQSMGEKLDTKIISNAVNRDKLMFDWFSNEQETPQDKLNVLLDHLKELEAHQVELYNSENLEEALRVSDEIIEFEKQVYNYSVQIRKENERNAKVTEDLLRKQAYKEMEYRNDKQTMEARWFQLQEEKEDVKHKRSKKGKQELQKIAEDELKLQSQYNELIIKHRRDEEEIAVRLKRKEQHVLSYLDCVNRINKAYERQNKLLQEAQNIQAADNVLKEAEAKQLELKENEIKNIKQEMDKFNLAEALKFKDDNKVREALVNQIKLIEKYQELTGKTKTTETLLKALQDTSIVELRNRANQKNMREDEQIRQDTEAGVKQMSDLLSKQTQENDRLIRALGNSARLMVSGLPVSQLERLEFIARAGETKTGEGRWLKFEEDIKAYADLIDTFTKTKSEEHGTEAYSKIIQMLLVAEEVRQKLAMFGEDNKYIQILDNFITELQQNRKIFAEDILQDLATQQIMEDKLKSLETRAQRFNVIQAQYMELSTSLLDSFLSKGKTVEAYLQKLEIRLEGLQSRLPQDTGASAIMPRAFGGITYGKDSIPALLSPGEFVVNASASRKFYSQLVAMNSSPKHFASGGSVINGDFNISMNSSGNEHVDVIKIGKLLRREIRRGTLSLV